MVSYHFLVSCHLISIKHQVKFFFLWILKSYRTRSLLLIYQPRASATMHMLAVLPTTGDQLCKETHKQEGWKSCENCLKPSFHNCMLAWLPACFIVQNGLQGQHIFKEKRNRLCLTMSRWQGHIVNECLESAIFANIIYHIDLKKSLYIFLTFLALNVEMNTSSLCSFSFFKKNLKPIVSIF